MESNYFKLAEQYAGFLAALGGISITVLALVLALRRSPVNPKAYPILIASLILATFACFTGVHLMSETAALSQYSLFGVKQTGLGPYLISTVDICIAPMLTGFSLMLLPRVYFRVQENQGDIIRIQRIANGVFYSVVGIACFWAIYYFAARLYTPVWWWGWIIGLLLLCLVIWYDCHLRQFTSSSQKFWARLLFIFLTAAIASPILGFIAATDANPPLLLLAIPYYIVIILSGTSLLCLKSILFKKEAETDSEKKDAQTIKVKIEQPIKVEVVRFNKEEKTEVVQLNKEEVAQPVTINRPLTIGEALVSCLVIVGFAISRWRPRPEGMPEENKRLIPSTPAGEKESGEQPPTANRAD